MILALFDHAASSHASASSLLQDSRKCKLAAADYIQPAPSNSTNNIHSCIRLVRDSSGARYTNWDAVGENLCVRRAKNTHVRGSCSQRDSAQPRPGLSAYSFTGKYNYFTM